jgi:DNA-binding MarR family transcriptional regulator
MDKKMLIEYIEDMLKVKTEMYEVEVPKKLPILFSRNFKIYMSKIKNVKCIIVVSNNIEESTIKTLKKRFDMITKELNRDEPFIYVAENLDWYTREQLIIHGISFVVPGKQIYLPFLGQVLISKFGPTGTKRERFTPAAQLVLIEMIEMDMKTFGLSDFSNVNISRMSVSRALNEMVELDLIEKHKNGKDIYWEILSSKKELWKNSESYLFNPVIKIVCLKKKDTNKDTYINIAAGEDALSKISLLNGPEKKVMAISNKDFNRIKNMYDIVSPNDYKAMDIELWKHEIPRHNEMIHPLALSLSFIGTYDERIKESVEDMVADYWEEKDNGTWT